MSQILPTSARSGRAPIDNAVLPPVTVVIPTHRRPHLLRSAVRSVLVQDYTGPLEILVVFDACAPELPTLNLPENCTLRAVVNRRTRGLAGARNTGILAAQHDLVAFLDDDDEWCPAKLAAQVRLLDQLPQVDLVGTAMSIDDGRSLRVRRVGSAVVSRQDLITRGRLAGPHASSLLFRRAALLGPIGLVDEDLPRSYGEDYDILLRTAQRGDIHVVDEPLIVARWQGQSYYYAQWQAYAEALQYLLDKHDALDGDRHARGRTHAQLAFALASSGHRRAAIRHALTALRARGTALRAWLALGIAARLISGDAVARTAQRFGRGI